ncbi:MAG: RnfABCDGE type electron transport complex subunit D [Ruminococcaceae bacterium]|nr:RnfABCDGE type electron transport complex subunit D [Oscillospiraceae bacterium]
MKLLVSSAPHITGKDTTTSLMRDLIIAMVPAMLASVYFFGFQALLLIAVSTAACVGFEALYQKMTKQPITVADLSAAVTGILLAFNCPPSLPLWAVVVGAFFAIIIVKQLFGGLGFNFANPAIVARIILGLGYTGLMTAWTFPTPISGDAVATATPLAAYANGAGTAPAVIDMFVGSVGGVLGETSALALLIGFAYLLVKKVISPTIPVVYVATVAIMAVLLGVDPVVYVLGGGLLLGAIFMATDYVTSPYTEKGKIIFGIGLGVITVIIRRYGSMAEGVSYAILLMNLVVPYINKATRQKPLGAPKKVKEAK